MSSGRENLSDNHSSLYWTGSDRLLDLYLSLAPDARNARFASTSRVAQALGLSQRTIQSWINKGLVAAIRIGKKYQLDLDSLRAYLSTRSAP